MVSRQVGKFVLQFSLFVLSLAALYYVYGTEYVSPQVTTSYVALVLVGFMFTDTFLGSVDMASAGVRYAYEKATSTLYNPVNDYPEEEREGLEQAKKLKVGGLYNEGNTCFMNTVVQSLASLQHLKKVMLENIHYGETNHEDVQLSVVLNRILDQLNVKMSLKHTYSTSELIKSLGQESRYSGYDQEDAQEFFQAMLHGLEKDIKKRLDLQKPKPDTIITPFDGISATRVGCLECSEMEGIRRGVVASLDFSLGNLASSARGSEIKLEQLMDDYCSMETISGVECYRCSLIKFRQDLERQRANSPVPQLKETFQQRIAEVDETLKAKVIDEKKYATLKPSNRKEQCDKSKQTMLGVPTADIIMIHINRSVFNMVTGATTKNYTTVKFPSILDLKQYVVDTESELNNDPTRPMRAMDDPGTGMMYMLKAVVVHFGSHNFGHYVCYRKCDKGYWWRISDHSVELAYENQVFNAQGVFMLFYEKTFKAARQDAQQEEEKDEEGTDLTDMIQKSSL